jgi:hypothetical protein
MKRFTLIISLVLNFGLIFSQENDTIKRTYNDIEDLKTQIKNEEIELLKYIDSTFNYEVDIPKWLTLRESGNPELWGGTLPAIDGIENAILITGYHKNEFKSFKDFKEKVVEKNVFGQPTQMSSNHIFMGKKVLDEVPNIGPAYLQYHMWNNRLYDCQFVLTETKTAYVWINYTATRETYDKNLEKFNEFMKGFKIIE